MKIDLEGRKYLITSGCSFTDGFNMKEKGSWAYYLSNLLGLELRNKARGGSGNEYISDSIIIELMNHPQIRNECIVGVAWSDVSRLMSSIQEGKYNVLDTVQPHDFLIFENTDEGKYVKYKDASMFFSDIPFCVYKTYLAITKLNYFLDSLNIPYFYIDAINKNKITYQGDKFTIHGHSNHRMEFNFSDWPPQYSSVLNQKFNDEIFRNVLKIHEHDSILDFMFTDYDKYEKGNPGHPNDIASKEIAQNIYNQII